MKSLLLVGWSLLLAQADAPPVDLLRPEQSLLAIFNLESQIRVESAILRQAEERYEANLEERDRYDQRLARLYAELEAGWQAPPETFDPDGIRRADEELERLEKAQELAWAEGRRLRRSMLESRSRIGMLRTQVDGLLRTLPSDRESLTGYWDVTFLSGGEQGVFFLVQSGAVLTGEYGLQGGFRGSLQGTYIDDQVALQRIDTRLGRVMDLEGLVSAEGDAIRGTWRRFDLSSGKPATGAWVARRREAASDEGLGPDGP